MRERSIPIAFDRISRKKFIADEVFQETKSGYLLRKDSNLGLIDLTCYECDQKLIIAPSSRKRLHFKHLPKSGYCTLKDGNLSKDEFEKYIKALEIKESDRHFELKFKIAELLANENGIDKDSISVDNKFIISNGEKRKPDVYCCYFNKEIAFEIQLSDLSYRYILDRYKFYRHNKIYLIWILDNFDIKGQSRLELDIKYLTEYENFFKLDENVRDFRLICDYKYNFLTDSNQLLSKWLSKSVKLGDLKFSDEIYQVYYYNFGKKRDELVEKQLIRQKELEEINRKREEERKKNNAIKVATTIVEEIKRLRESKEASFDVVISRIESLDNYELNIFNQRLSIKDKNPLIHWFSAAQSDDFNFLRFIIDCEKIDYKINKNGRNGFSALKALLQNHHLNLVHKEILLQRMLVRGYYIKNDEFDEIGKEYNDCAERRKKIVLYRVANDVIQFGLVDSVFDHKKLVYILESIRSGNIIGFRYKPNEWIAFANNAIDHYQQYWNYIELAFKHYNLWNTLISLDKNGSFKRKLEALYKNRPMQSYDFDHVLHAAYSELIQ